MQLQRTIGLLVVSVSIGIAGCVPKSQSNAQISQAPTTTQTPLREPDVVYVLTPQEVVDEMLALAKVTKNDVIYDLGSGDGRISVTAAQRFGTKGFGVDINPERIREANANAQKAGVTNRVKFLNQDLFTTDISQATVVTLYLLPELNVRLRPQLFKQLKPGTRIVSHDSDMGEWQPEPTVQTKEGSTIYLWTIPKEVLANLR